MKRITRPSGGVPSVRRTPAQLESTLRALSNGTGPIAIDTERAAMYRFDDRAYLIQLRRDGAGSFIVDPTEHPEQLRGWQDELMGEVPWLLHAAHTDLPALMALGWCPTQLLDTQIAAKLLGCHRLGLSPLLEEFLSISIPKDKGNADWSRRPLANSLLAYAALDVEFLLEMHQLMVDELSDLDRMDWYVQECEHDLVHASPLKDPEWFDMKGARFLHPHSRAAFVARHLFETRQQIARSEDIPPERLLSSKLIVAVATLPQRDATRELLQDFRHAIHGPGADRVNPHRHSGTMNSFLDAMSRAYAEHREAKATAGWGSRDKRLDDPELQHRRPDPKTWKTDHPMAWDALEILRESNEELCEELGLGTDTIVVSRQLKFVAWEFAQRVADQSVNLTDVDSTEDCLGQLLTRAGCRPWQVELMLNDATAYLMDEVTQ
ncbi:HRDC domain-containing protein [Corynebacterium sp. HMSC28B08]|uniref:HRDC domain-containing protein n=1 Tax=Corynebacterium sp. HMSC28B08 TaxID=1581066 RepID=UPI0008A53B27|nr:HRDC domain-containing protein [Corynebacterium sp. HMSC28B08]OFT89710.1 hypothetical protein HMPREF3098_05190 [Corynebacterium sp. HMSC28B08]